MTIATNADRRKNDWIKQSAANLSAELARKGYTDREAARRLGLTNSYVSRRASGSVEMSVSDVFLFAGFLGIEPTKLLHLDSNQEPIGSQPGLEKWATVTSIVGRERKPTARRWKPGAAPVARLHPSSTQEAV